MTQEWLKSALYAEQLSLSVLLLVHGVAFVLGAFHALAPGHGKSLMAAYLVGSSGRVRDAFLLALTITVAHVFSVIVIGLVALWLTDFFWPERINRWIGLFSGIAISAIGVALFLSRLRAKPVKPVPHHSHHNPEDPVNDHQHCHHDHDHNHNHNHDHHHHDYRPSASLWSNIALGISGGIMPCPKAIVILLLAISLQRIALGITIILAFSLGLAAVLMTLGFLLVKAEHLVRNRMAMKRWQLISVLGALVIILLGGFITVQALMALSVINFR